MQNIVQCSDKSQKHNNLYILSFIITLVLQKLRMIKRETVPMRKCDATRRNKQTCGRRRREIRQTPKSHLYLCLTSRSPHIMSLQHGNIWKAHNWFVEREMSYVITFRAVVENVMSL